MVAGRCTRPAVLLAALLWVMPGAAQEGDFAQALAEAQAQGRGGEIVAATRAFERAAALADNAGDRARAWFELGLFLERSNQPGQAAEAFERVLAVAPPTAWHPTACERAARLHQRTGRLDRAVAAYERLAALPDMPPETIQQALAGQMRALQQMLEADRAAAVARRLLDEHPAGPYAAHAASVLADFHVQRGEHEAARVVVETEARRPGGDAGLLLRTAARMAEARALDAALALLELHADLRPEDPSGLQLLHDIHRLRGTVGDYERQLLARSRDEQQRRTALQRLADLYAREQAPDKELAVLEQLAEALPEDPNAHVRAARAAARAGNAPRALQHYERALKLSPGDGAYLSELGELHARLGDREQALAAWKAATRHDPRDPDTARALGRTLHAHGYYHDAVRVYLEARQAAGEPAAFAVELGETYEALLFLDRAVAEYLAAMRMGNGSGRHAERRLQLLAADDVMRDDVIAALERAREAHEASDGALLILGFAYLKAGELGKARDAFAAVTDAGRRSGTLVEIALSLEHSGDREGAVAVYEAALAGGLPDELGARAALRLAELHEGRGDWRRARQALEGALDADLPEHAAQQVRLALADILVRRAGEPEQAAELYEQVAARASDEDAARRARWGLADCAFVEGDYERAATEYRRLADMEDTPDAPPPAPFGPFADHRVHVLMVGAPPAPRPMGPVYAEYQLAEIAFRSGRFPQARRDFERLAREHPHSTHANDALERALLIATRFTGRSPAERQYVEAVKLLDRGEAEQARRILSRIFSLGPDEAPADAAALLHADACARFGEAAEAAEEYEQVARKFPDSPLAPEALLRGARLRSRLPGQREAALALYRRLMAQYPDSPEAGEAEVGVGDLLPR